MIRPMLRSLIIPFEIRKERTMRLKKTVEKKEVRIPILSTTAKPLTAPVPNWNSTKAVISVVRLASKMVQKAFWKPTEKAAGNALPRSLSSRIRSKIRMLASTAIPTVNNRPAIPGKVRVLRKTISRVTTSIRFMMRDRSATIPAAL